MMASNKNIPVLRFKEFKDDWEIQKAGDLFINSRIKGNKELPIYSVTLDRGMVPRNSLDRTMTNDADAGDNLFVAKNNISYNMMRMWQGAYGLAPIDCMVSPAYVVLNPKDNVLSDYFVKYFRRERNLYLFTAYSYGVTSDRLRLYFKDFSQIKFVVPKFPEQQKIASFLSAVDEKIQLLTRKKELLEQYKKGVMQQLFSGKLRFKDEHGKDYPEWEEQSFGRVCKFINGKAYSQYELLSKGKYRVLRVGNLFSSKEWYYSDLELEEDKYIKKGDLIYAWSASFGPRFWEEEQVIYHYHIWKVVPSNYIDKLFLFYALAIDVDKLKSLSQGGTMFHITKGNIESRLFKFPSIDEQQKIARHLSAVDSKIEIVATQITRTQTFKKGLLQQMFV